MWDLKQDEVVASPSLDSGRGSCKTGLLGLALEFTDHTLIGEIRTKVIWVPQKRK